MRAISYESKLAEQQAVRKEYEPKKKKEGAMQEAKFLKEGAEYVDNGHGGFRLELTPDQQLEIHIEEGYIQQEEEKIAENRREIKEKLKKLSLEEVIKTYPEFAEKIESFKLDLDKDGLALSLLREKETPDIAVLVCSDPKNQTKNRGRATLNIPEPRLPEEIIQVEFKSVCACCSIESEGLKSPFLTKFPKSPAMKDGEGYDAYTKRCEREITLCKADMIRWKESEEAQKNKEWHEQKKQEFKKVVQQHCAENGIRYLILREADIWAKRYGALDGVEMVEITDLDKVNRIVKSLKSEGQQTEKIPSIEIDG